MRVAIHRNLTTNKWVMSAIKVTRNGERKGLVIEKGLDAVLLEDVSFVTPKSVARIVANIQNPGVSAGREVVAYAVGTLVERSSHRNLEGVHVSWSPFKGTDFYLDSGEKASAHYSVASFGEMMICAK